MRPQKVRRVFQHGPVDLLSGVFPAKQAQNRAVFRQSTAGRSVETSQVFTMPPRQRRWQRRRKPALKIAPWRREATPPCERQALPLCGSAQADTIHVPPQLSIDERSGRLLVIGGQPHHLQSSFGDTQRGGSNAMRFRRFKPARSIKRRITL